MDDKQTLPQTTSSSNAVSTAAPGTAVVASSAKRLGRPLLYKPEMCEQAIELGKKGFSREMISSELGITWKTLLEWAQTYPEFGEALEEAKLEEMIWFERLGQAHLVEVPQGARLNTSLWSRSVAARFPQKYRENAKIEVTGKDDKPIEIDVLHDFSQELVNQLLATRQKDAEPGNSN